MDRNRDAGQRIARLMPLANALARMDKRISPVAQRVLSIDVALGRALAVAPVAAQGLPTTPIALRDGWALRSEATLDAGSYAPAMLAEAPVPVELGDRLPVGADAVAPMDAIEFRGATPTALMTIAPGEGALPAEADVRKNAPLLRAGRRLSGVDLAVLAFAGVSDVSVREPRVRVAAAHAESNRIIDGIVALICRALAHEGAEVIPGNPTSADNQRLDGVLTDKDCDAVIVVGGSGAGARDRSVQALSRLGHVDFHGVGLSPGETAAFGAIASRPVLVVPGRFDAALAVWLTLGRRMIASLCAAPHEDYLRSVVLKRKITSTVGLAELVVLEREGDGIVPVSSGYISPRALARADGWILISSEIEGYPAGSVIEMRRLP